MFETYTAADGDDYVNEIIEDFGTVGEKTSSNPTGIILTKWNGERAMRRFIMSTLNLSSESQVNQWIDKEFDKAWKKYDVNDEGKI